jgi:hypothetical protein
MVLPSSLSRQHFLYFLREPQGHGSLPPTLTITGLYVIGVIEIKGATKGDEADFVDWCGTVLNKLIEEGRNPHLDEIRLAQILYGEETRTSPGFWEST